MKNFLALLVLGMSVSVFGQLKEPYTPDSHISCTSIEHNGNIRCATMENDSILRSKHPEMGSLDQNEAWLQERIKEHKETYGNKSGQKLPILIIPVVVHVIHNGDAVGTGENIDDGQVLSQIQVLNEDFRKEFGTPGYNTDPVGADVEIQFCMAQVDPLGNPTDGIDRVDMGQATWTSMASIDGTLKPATQWDPTLYCNMWTVRFGGGMGGTLGYAQFPDGSGLGGLNPVGGAADSDGVVSSYDAFGSQTIYPAGTYNPTYNLGRTMTHEVGHWLGLRHIWGDGGCGVDDFCADTPTSDGSNFGCPNVTNCASVDMVENYMDYTDDNCMNIFTEDQKTRIRTVMAVCPRRMELSSSTVCSSPTSDDAGIFAIVDPQGTICGSTSFIPIVTLRNYGNNDITSVDIVYDIDGGGSQTFNWTGTLTPGSTIDVNLPSMSTSVGAHTFNVATNLPNGIVDGNTSNDANSNSFSIAMGTAVTLSLDTDCWGYETYWELEDVTTTVIYSGGNSTGIPPGGGQGAAGTDAGAYGSQTTITENWCLADGCYDFTIYDDWGDGMDAISQGCPVDGDYTITEDATSNVLGGLITLNFGPSETQNFCIVPLCTTDAGTMTTAPTLTLCGTGSQIAIANGDETLDGDDVLEYYLHDGSGSTLGTTFASNGTPTFSFTGGMTYGTTYYISTVVGNDDGGGNVNLTDACLSVAVGTPVIWYDFPTIGAGSGQTICFGDNVILSGTGAVSYSWDNGVTDGVSFSPASTQTYTVTGTDANSCQNTDQVIVTVNALPSVGAGSNQTACSGDPVTLNGSGATSYSWDNGVTDGVSFNPTLTTTYTVTGTDGNSCQNTDQVIVTVNSLPSVNAGVNQSICPGGSVTLSGSGASTYAWNNGVTDGASFNPGATLTYTVTGTDGNGCQNTDQTIVTVNSLPSVNAGTNQSVCQGNSLTLSGSGAVSYSWDNGVTDGVGFIPASTQTYTVTGTDGNGCQNTDQVIVTVNSLPTVGAGSNQTICSGNPSTLSGSGASSYSWDNGITNGVSFNPVSTLTYTVTGTDGNGCQNTDQVQVTVNSLPSVGAGTDQGICPGGSVTLNGSGATSYSWDNGVTNGNSFNPVSTLTYTVTGTDANSCQNTDQVIVTVNSLPTVSAGGNQSVCAGNNVTLSGSGAISYSWDNGVTNSVPFSPGATLTYTVTGTDGNGCQNTDQAIITVNSLPIISNLTETCNGTNTNYTVSFDVAGGLGPYIVAGATGSFSGSTWTSNPIVSGVPYNLTVADANGCSPANVSGVQLCNCTTNSGTMVTAPGLSVCGTSSQTAIHNGDETFDGDDVMDFLIHDNSGAILGTTFGSNSTPTFSFGGGMVLGTTYYISAVVGNDDGGGNVDLTDPCLSVSSGTPIVWHAIPTVGAGTNQTVCAGNSVTLSGTGAISYSWDNGVTDAISFIPGATQTYTVTGTDANSCQNTDQVIVTVNTLPTVSAGSNQSVCTGNPATLNGTGASTYTWDNGVTDGISFTPGSTQTYTVTGTDGNSCQNTDQVIVTVNVLPTVGAGSNQSVCDGNPVTLNGSGALTYSWNNGVTDGSPFTPAGTLTYTVTGTDANSCQNTDQVIVTVNTLPSVNAGTNQSICDGNSITLSGAGAISYSWDNSVNDGVSFSPSSTLTYTVTGTDANSCQNTDQVTVTVNSLPSVNAGSDQTVCDGSSVTLSGSGASTYSWDNGVTDGNSFIPLASGTYTVTGTDGNSCQNTDQILITVNGLPTVSAGSDQTICDGSSVTLSGSGASTYAWDNGVTDGIGFIPTGTLTYTVTGTDGNSCENTDQVIINVNPLPTFSLTSIDPTTCSGVDGSISIAGLNNSTPYDITYEDGSVVGPTTLTSNGSGIITINGLSAGNYTNFLVELNSCGTIDASTISLSDPTTLSFTSITTDEYCSADDASIIINDTGGSGTVTYSIDNGASFQPGNTFTNLDAGTYDIVIIDASSCQSVGTILISDNPAAIIDSVNVSDETCAGNSDGGIIIYVTGAGAISYSIDNGVNSQGTDTFSGLANGSYDLLITDGNGCLTTGNSVVNLSASMVITENVINTSCGNDNGSAELIISSGASPFTYNWIGLTAGNTNSVSNLLSGIQDYTVTDNNGCSVLDSVFIEASNGMIIDANITNETCEGNGDGGIFISGVTGGTATFDFLWEDGSSDNAIYSLTGGIYSVTVTDNDGCTVVDTFIVDTDACNEAVIVHNAISPNNDGENDTWIVEGIENYPNASVEIFNRWGTSLFQSSNYQNDWDGTWNDKDLPVGVYFYIIILSSDEVHEGAITIMR